MGHNDVRFGHPMMHSNVMPTREFIDPADPSAYNAAAVIGRENAAVRPVDTKIVLPLPRKFAQEQADLPVNAATRGFSRTPLSAA